MITVVFHHCLKTEWTSVQLQGVALVWWATAKAWGRRVRLAEVRWGLELAPGSQGEPREVGESETEEAQGREMPKAADWEPR